MSEAQERVIAELLGHCTPQQRMFFDNLYPVDGLDAGLFGRAVLLIERMISNNSKTH